MKNRNYGIKLLALIISVMMLFGCMPLAVSAEEFVSENVMLNHVDMENSVSIVYYSWNSEYTEAVDSTDRFNKNGALAGLVDGNTATNHDFYAYSETHTNWIGARYALDDVYYIGEMKIYAGFNAYPDYYRVYASDTLETLYSPANMVTASIKCTDAAQILELNRNVKYVAFIYDNISANSNNARPKEIELWSAQLGASFVSENVLTTKLDSATGILVDVPTGYVSENTRFDSNGALLKAVDGDAFTATDVYGALDWTPAKYVGAQYSLTESVYIEKATVYAGYNAYPETYDVYASDNLASLYTAGNKVGSAIVCGDNAVDVAINKPVQYVAFVCTAYNGNMRVKEFQLWSGDASAVFIAENALKNLESATGILAEVSNGFVSENSRFDSNGALAASTDGDTATAVDVYGALDWEYPKYVGAQYTLAKNAFIGNAVIYAGTSDNPETYDVYASDDITNLYETFNKVGTVADCTGNGVEVEINKNVRYIAFVCVAYKDLMRVKEFEAWTADPTVVPVEDPHKKVLTIGNSFAENASVYASEIAYANGQQLTYGYLKYPSCTLEQHLNAALNDLAVFKFQLTDPTGKKTVVKSGDGVSFTPADGNTNENGATIKEALEYTDWDIIVFQQESSNARYYETYSYLGDLIEYVKGICPDAELMFHEVWRWGTWEADQFDLIKANSEKAAREYGLELIPTGLAFENAREAIGDVTIVNEDDGYYQHANTYGMYIAGCVYTATIFDIEISSDTFATHPYVNDTGKVATFTAAANAAVKYYDSYGDLDQNGAIDAEDISALRKYLVKNNAAKVDTTLADANNDGVIDIRDLIRVKRLSLNIQ